MGKIPSNITREDLLAVIKELEPGLHKVPTKYHSNKFCLVHRGRHYPPKYVIRRANVTANGKELEYFYGGPETNEFLRHKGFEVIICPNGGTRYD